MIEAGGLAKCYAGIPAVSDVSFTRQAGRDPGVEQDLIFEEVPPPPFETLNL